MIKKRAQKYVFFLCNEVHERIIRFHIFADKKKYE